MSSIPVIPECIVGGRPTTRNPAKKIWDLEPLESPTPAKSSPRPNQDSNYDFPDPSKSAKGSSQDTSSPNTSVYNGPSPARQPRQYSLEQLNSLQLAADGLLTKLYRLKKALHLPAEGSLKYSDVLWKAGIVPDLPKLCITITKAFPQHPRDLSLEKVCHDAQLLSSFLLLFFHHVMLG